MILGAGSPVTEHMKRTWLNSGTVLSRSLAVKFGASSTLYFIVGASESRDNSAAYSGATSGRGKEKSDTCTVAPENQNVQMNQHNFF